MNIECDHKWIYQDSKKYEEINGFITRYIKVNNFYCEKCLESKTTKKEDYSREIPDWY